MNKNLPKYQPESPPEEYWNELEKLLPSRKRRRAVYLWLLLIPLIVIPFILYRSPLKPQNGHQENLKQKEVKKEGRIEEKNATQLFKDKPTVKTPPFQQKNKVFLPKTGPDETYPMHTKELGKKKQPSILSASTLHSINRRSHTNIIQYSKVRRPSQINASFFPKIEKHLINYSFPSVLADWKIKKNGKNQKAKTEAVVYWTLGNNLGESSNYGSQGLKIEISHARPWKKSTWLNFALGYENFGAGGLNRSVTNVSYFLGFNSITQRIDYNYFHALSMDAMIGHRKNKWSIYCGPGALKLIDSRSSIKTIVLANGISKENIVHRQRGYNRGINKVLPTLSAQLGYQFTKKMSLQVKTYYSIRSFSDANVFTTQKNNHLKRAGIALKYTL